MPSNLSSIRGSQPGIWLETLLRIARGMGPDRPFQSGITSMLRTLSEKLSFYRAHLVLFDPETGLLRLSLADAQPKSNHANYAPGVGVTGHVFATGQPVIVKKMKGDPLFLSLLFERTEKELEELSFISVPIFAPSQKNSMSAREVIGTLNADTMYVSDADLELRRLFLETAAALIANESAFLRENSGRYKAGSLQTGTKETALRSANEIFAVQAKTMDGILKHAQATVSGNMPVLISGEPGVGKKTLAVWIHYSGSRKDSPFIVCSCLGLTKDNALTELCGYQKSAFLGAMHTQKGLFEQANTGTIYLDAVDMLPEDAQQALLLLIKEQKVLRKGARDHIPVNVRVLASTRRSLSELTSVRQFLPELCERLSANEIHLPPLRERYEDIIPLAEYFLKQCSVSIDQPVKRIARDALELIMRYFWPGNISELAQCMMQAAKQCTGQIIKASDLPPSLHSSKRSEPETTLSLMDAVARYEKELLVDSLVKTDGNMLKASSALKASYRIVNYKVKKYGIDPKQFSRKGKKNYG